jgi:hypothetical protein
MISNFHAVHGHLKSVSSVPLPIYGLDYLFFWCFSFTSLYILDINPLSDEYLTKTLPFSVDCFLC